MYAPWPNGAPALASPGMFMGEMFAAHASMLSPPPHVVAHAPFTPAVPLSVHPLHRAGDAAAPALGRARASKLPSRPYTMRLPRAMQAAYEGMLREALARCGSSDLDAARAGAQLLDAPKLGVHMQPPSCADFGLRHAPRPEEAMLSRALYRSLCLVNSGSVEVVIALPKLVPQLEGAGSVRVLDDEGIALAADAQAIARADEDAPAVVLPPGASYNFTIELRPSAKCGLHASRFVVGVGVRLPHIAPAALQEQYGGLGPLEPLACPVTLALVSNTTEFVRLSEDAPQFVPGNLRTLFDRPARVAFADEGRQARAERALGSSIDLDTLLTGEALPRTIREWALASKTRIDESDEASEARVALRALASLSAVERNAIAENLRKCDMFHVQLCASSGGGQTAGSRARLVQFEAPGVEEGRPALSAGDVVRVRPAYAPESFELRMTVVQVQKGTVVLKLPDEVAELVTRSQHIDSRQAGQLAGFLEALYSPTAGKGGAEHQEKVPPLRVHVSFAVDNHLFAALGWTLEQAQALPQPPRWIAPLLESLCQEGSTDGQNDGDGACARALAEAASLAESSRRRAGDQVPGSNGAMESHPGTSVRRCEPFNELLNREQLAAVEKYVFWEDFDDAHPADSGELRLPEDLSARVGGTDHGGYACNDAAPPMCIFGPPGTGKSSTVVEVVRQVLLHTPDAKVLVCAPTNFAADLLASQLATAPSCAPGVTLDKGYLVRINAATRLAESVKADVIPFCYFSQSDGGHGGIGRAFDEHAAVQAALSSECSIIVATCGGATLLARARAGSATSDGYGGNQADRRVSHVIVDEAGQALVAETLCPLVMAILVSPPPPFGLGLEVEEPRVLLVGDPLQLGPVVHTSVKSVRKAMTSSLLGALMRTKGLGGLKVAALLRSYRSSQALLSLPSRLFYEDALISAADPDSVRPPAWIPPSASSEVPPLVMYGVHGRQVRQGDHSWFNPFEATVVTDLVESLVTAEHVDTSASELGVVALFRSQVHAIRHCLRQRGLGAVRVGTIDDYQGQEARVLLISTVLTRPASLRSAGGGSGSNAAAIHAFSSPNRFNVAITRAKALLVVCGHPQALAEDSNWRALLKHCSARGAFMGAGAEYLSARMRGADTADAREDSAYDDLGATMAQLFSESVLGSAGAIDDAYDLEDGGGSMEIEMQQFRIEL